MNVVSNGTLNGLMNVLGQATVMGLLDVLVTKPTFLLGWLPIAGYIVRLGEPYGISFLWFLSKMYNIKF